MTWLPARPSQPQLGLHPLARPNRAFIIGLLALALSLVTSAVPARATHAGPGIFPGGNYFRWVPNTSDTTNSRLYRIHNSVLLSTSYRSGSGSGSNDPCLTGQGRLPAGWYDTAWEDFGRSKNDLIKGRVIGIQNMQCPSGQWRIELFMHTEETATNGQSCPTSGDDPYCWEGVSGSINDWKSDGCIKVAHPTDISSLASWFDFSILGDENVQYHDVLVVWA